MKLTIYSLSKLKFKVKDTFAEGKKWSPLLLTFLLIQGNVSSQTLTYDDFEGKKCIHYSDKTGVLDSMAKNPKPDSLNKSKKCGLYVRNGAKKFDNIKMKLPSNLTDVESYATYLGIPPRFKMKIYTSAPVGTLVEILLGRESGNNDYPSGTHSQYQAYTTVTGKWETLEFKFSQIPQGSETSAKQIDQVTLLFNPNSSTSDTYYFDEITGPPVVIKDIVPNPVAESKKNEESPKKVTPKKKTKK
jgi:hypothetical protein